jgi:arginyl-tRNA synthetase
MLKVDPVKNMLFNPRESIDFDGNTGPFIQYTYTRTLSVFRKAEELHIHRPDRSPENIAVNDKEKNLLRLIHEFPAVLADAGETFNPSLIANFIFELVKEYNQFYHDYSILKEEDAEIRKFRLELSQVVSGIVKNGMELLGVEMPERM